MLRRPLLPLFAILLVVSLVPAPPARAEWPAYGVPGSDAAAQVNFSLAAPDGAGGILSGWDEIRTDYDVYVQRTDAHGNLLWGSGATPVAVFTSHQFLGDIASDDLGNAYLVWLDQRAPLSIRVQKVDPAGTLMWNVDGVVLASGAASYLGTVITADESGGCVVAWHDIRYGDYDVFVQRVSSAGATSWLANGIDLTNLGQTQQYARIVRDDATDFIVGWEDDRSGTSRDIYAQKINSDGVIKWAANGVVVVATVGVTDQDLELVSDGAGGAVFVYETNTDLGGQRLNGAGTRLWGTNGFPVSDELGSQYNPRIISDGAGGAIAVWEDTRNGPDDDVFAQRMSLTGSPMWDYQGALVCINTADQYSPDLATDGHGGAIIVWRDLRSASTTNDIYAQRMDASGIRLWGSSGRAVLSAPNNQTAPKIQSDGSGNAIFICYDDRGYWGRATAQRIDGQLGYWGYPEPDVYSVADTPGDQGGHVSLNWYRSERDKVGGNLITHYSVWRAIDALPFAPVSSDASFLVKLEDVTPDMAGPVYRVEHTAAADYFWEYVGQQSAIYASGYSFNAETRGDSSAAGPADHTFQVVAHTYDSFTFWPSQPISGHSVDNLAPAAPLMLTAQRIGGDNVLLEWSPGDLVGDLADYVIYRASAGGVTPIPGNFLANETDTTAVDTGATASSAFWYIVTARDVHDNQSDPSNEAMVNGGPTGVGDTPVPNVLTLLGNAPNPFGSSTIWRVGMPAGGDVTLEVYDVAGRRVRSERTSLAAGWQAVNFDGRDGNGRALPSGVYFYRVSAGGHTRTAKMVVQR